MADPRFHKNSGSKALGELATLVGGQVDTMHEELSISDVAPLNTATATDISFFDNTKYKDDFKNTKAGACIISPEMAEFAPEGCALLISKNPYKSYALIAQSFYPANIPETKICDGARVHDSATIGKGCFIGENAVIGANVKIGNKTWIESNAVIGESVEIGDHCRIGSNTTVTHTIMGDYSRIYPNSAVGQDGFGFAIDPAGHVKVPQLGRVMIGDHVEIGASTCIDRGAGPDTVIGDGAWIDNLVQIGHNVSIGKGCVIVAQVGIAGSTVLEDYVVLGGQVGVTGHLKIGMGSRIAAQSGIMQDVPAGSELMGSPAVPIKQHLRQVVALKKLTKPKK